MIQAIIVVGLASFYVTYTVMNLEGPFGLYHKILSLAGVMLPVYGDDGKVVSYVDADIKITDWPIAKLIRCFWCFTTWVCLAVTIIYGILSSLNIGQCAFVWLASAGLSGWLFERISDGTSE